MSNNDQGGLLNRFTVGFDHLYTELARFQHAATYPPHNIVKLAEDKYLLEFAVAGYAKEDIILRQEDGYLVIESGSKTDERDYMFRGISARKFSNKFRLADFVEVISAEMENGLLKVTLEKIVPEELKPRSIEIK